MTTAPPLPKELEAFLKRGGKKFRCEDGDWDVCVETVPNKYLAKVLPAGVLVIGNNGCGDHLFLEADAAGHFSPTVKVFWHEGPQIEVFAKQLRDLTDPPPAKVSSVGPVYYHDGSTRVQIGDKVATRVFIFFRKEGRVRYVPGISKKNRNMEFNGLCWVGVELQNGPSLGTLVDPETNRLQKKVRFLSRSTDPIEEMTPDEEFE